jgi:para-aminobenzoate synthetase component 1
LRSEPIKGTRPRTQGKEAAVSAELLASVKDRAELAMIVDLVRNDLGRIAEVGSVAAAAEPSLMHLDYVHHTYYRVTAKPQAGTGVRDWLGASFPPGSITGAPKIEAMKLLQELEGVERGPYCGCFGWLGAGSCALAVAIRTMVIAGNRVRFSAGGGIVADSQPSAEWDEVLAKAARMMQALSGPL